MQNFDGFRPIKLNIEESEILLQKMLEAKPNPKMQEFLKKAKEYAKNHPIKNYDLDKQKIKLIDETLSLNEQKPSRDFIKEYLTDE